MRQVRAILRQRILAKPGRGIVNTTGWLTTFNDLVTLLMVFFVLLFSMSSIDTKRLKNFQSALQAGLGVLEAGQKTSVAIVDTNRPATADTDARIADTQTPNERQDQIAAMVDAKINTMQTAINVQTTYTDEGVVITLEDDVVFSSGSAQIHSGSYAILKGIAHLIRQFQNPVRIEGHTDNIPIRTPRYPSNWELSTARAVSVVKFLIEKEGIAPQRLSAIGYGDSMPLFANDTRRHRAANRRVNIVIVTENGGNHVN